MNFLRSIVVGQFLITLAEVPFGAFAWADDWIEDSRLPTQEEIRNCQREFRQDGVDPAFCEQGRTAICAGAVAGAGYSAQSASILCSDAWLQAYAAQVDGFSSCVRYLHPHFDVQAASKICTSGAASLIAGSITRDQYEACRETAIEAGFDESQAAHECIATPGLPEMFDPDKADPKGGRATVAKCFEQLRGLVDDHQRAHYCGTFPAELASAQGGKCVQHLIKGRGWPYHLAIVTCMQSDAARKAVGGKGFDACMDSAIWDESTTKEPEETRLALCAKSNLDPQVLGCVVRAVRNPGLDSYLYRRQKAGGLSEIGAICRNSNSHLQRCLRKSGSEGLPPVKAMDACLD